MGETPAVTGEQREETAQCRSLLQALTDGVIGVDASARVVYMNPAAEVMIGQELAAVRGRPIEQVFRIECTGARKSDRHDIRRLVQGATSTGTISNCHIGDDGKHIPIDYSVSSLGLGQGGVILFHDLSHGQELRRRLLYQATHDALTGLPNRSSIQQAVAWLHAAASREAGGSYSVLLMDLDHFKQVNDHHGHAVGDVVLAQAAHRISGSLRDQDSVGRWGGEEFLALLPETGPAHALRIAERVCHKVAKEPVGVDGKEIPISVSIGVASFPDDDTKLESMLAEADVALYEAKRTGRNRVCSAQQVDHSPLSVAGQIEQALDERRVLPAYQDIVDLKTGVVVAREALARIVGGTEGAMEATDFVDAAVRLRLVHRIDHQIALEAILNCNRPMGEARSKLPCFINVSADLFRHPELVDEIAASVRDHSAAGKAGGDVRGTLVVEFSEDELLHNVEETRRVLTPFLECGMQLGLEGFGEGGASLEDLVDLPVAYMKLEAQLITRALDDPRARAILKGVADTAHALGVVTIAEKVEDAKVLEMLREIGVDWGQGYLFGWPRFD